MQINTHIAVISLLVDDQEEALHFYTEKLGLEKRTDLCFGRGMRLLTVAPKGQKKPELALAQPDVASWGEDYVKIVRERKCRMVPWVFHTTDCHKTYNLLIARGVTFESEPTKQLYGTEAIFVDPYGNKFALLEASPEMRSKLDHRIVGTAA